MDNCLILIDVECSKSTMKEALISNIKAIQEQIKDYVLVLITENQIKIP